jgi:hypothetical protein
MRKLLPLLIFITIFLFTTVQGYSLSEHTIPSLQNGTTHYVGGTGPGNYTTIATAITNASDGDTIYVYPGTYKETLTLNKQLTLIGHDTATTKIQSNTTALTITADHCTITQFTITAASQGIFFNTAQYTTLTNNHINGCSRGITIDALIITFSLTNIQDNSFTNNDFGIISRAALVSIYHNTFSDNNRAIEHNGMFCNIGLNHIENNTDGIAIGGYLNNIARNAILNNIVGLLCFSHANNIHHNNFLYNDDNTYLESAFVNRWLNNFWTKPRLAPYPIRGVIPIPGGTEIAYYDFDPFPRVVPNTIPP